MEHTTATTFTASMLSILDTNSNKHACTDVDYKTYTRKRSRFFQWKKKEKRIVITQHRDNQAHRHGNLAKICRQRGCILLVSDCGFKLVSIRTKCCQFQVGFSFSHRFSVYLCFFPFSIELHLQFKLFPFYR